MQRMPLDVTYVPGLTRCSMEFYSEDTLSKLDTYTGKRRHRFNKFDTLSSTMPIPTQTGLSFTCSKQNPLVGLVTPWTFSGSSQLRTTATFIHDSLGGECTTYCVGCGIITYDAPWWDLFNAMEVWMERDMSSGDVSYGTFMRNVTGQTRLGVQPRFGYDIYVAGGSVVINYTEFDTDGNLIGVASSTFSLNPDWSDYKLCFYQIVRQPLTTGGYATMKILSSGFPVVGSDVTIPASELILLQQNPDSYDPPIPTPRSESTHLDPIPHVALLEDAKLTISAMACPLEMYTKLKYLVDHTVEPFRFVDIEGREFLCCFDKLSGSPRRYRGDRSYGYTLDMQVLVVH